MPTSTLAVHPLTPESLRTLSEKRRPGAVSLYLPTHRYGREIEQDRIRLQNLLREAENLGAELGWKSKTISELLEPARSRLEDARFWSYQGEGLALLLGSDSSHEFRLRESVGEFVYAGDRFCIRPLLPFVTPGEPFSILCLSQNQVRLLDCSRQGVREVDLYDIPETLEDSVGYDFEERSLQFHTGAAPQGAGDRAAQFHGQGRATDKSDEELEEFFRDVDRGIANLIGDPERPVVLAAVDYLMPKFRDVSKNLHVLEHGITGNPDHKKAEELHAAGLKVMAPLFEASERKLEKAIEASQASSRVETVLSKVLPAAHAARVDGLLVCVQEPVWGRFDESSQKVDIHATREPGDDDLLDLTISYGLKSGSEIHAVEPGSLPDSSSPLAALLRY